MVTEYVHLPAALVRPEPHVPAIGEEFITIEVHHRAARLKYGCLRTHCSATKHLLHPHLHVLVYGRPNTCPGALQVKACHQVGSNLREGARPIG